MTKAGNRSVSEQEPKAVGEAQAVAVFHDCGHQVCKEGRGQDIRRLTLGELGLPPLAGYISGFGSSWTDLCLVPCSLDLCP